MVSGFSPGLLVAHCLLSLPLPSRGVARKVLRQFPTAFAPLPGVCGCQACCLPTGLHHAVSPPSRSPSSIPAAGWPLHARLYVLHWRYGHLQPHYWHARPLCDQWKCSMRWSKRLPPLLLSLTPPRRPLLLQQPPPLLPPARLHRLPLPGVSLLHSAASVVAVVLMPVMPTLVVVVYATLSRPRSLPSVLPPPALTTLFLLSTSLTQSPTV